MNKFLKLIAKIAGLLIIVYIILTAIVYFFVHPDTYKPLIKKAFYKATGRQVTINGKMKLSLFPAPALTVNQVNIANPTGFKAPKNAKYFAKIGSAEIRLELFPLFKAKFHPSKLLLSNATINFLTTSSGKNNWSDLFDAKQRKNKKAIAVSNQVPNQNQAGSNIPNVLFPTIIISKTNLHFINNKTKNITDLSNIGVQIESANKGNAYSIELDGILHRKDPNLAIKFHSTSVATLNLKNKYYRFDSLKIITELSQFHEVKRPITLELNGNMLIWNKNLHATFNGLVRDNSGNIKLTLNEKNSIDRILLSINKFPINRVVAAFTGKTSITGTLNFNTTLLTRGDTLQACLKALDGSGEFKLSDGAIYGTNLQHIVITALNSIFLENTKIKLASEDEKPQTSFKEISASYHVNDGTVRSENILISGEQIKANGSGTVNLPKTSIDLKMLMTYSPKPNIQLPVVISGNLFAPTIQPNVKGLASQFLKSKIQKDIGKAIKGINLKSLFD